MEQKFHRESAKIYTFVPATRAAAGARIEPRLYSADVVPLRYGAPRSAVPVAPRLEVLDFGSGWYHAAAIESSEPSRH